MESLENDGVPLPQGIDGTIEGSTYVGIGELGKHSIYKMHCRYITSIPTPHQVNTGASHMWKLIEFLTMR
ncbi:MAG: hypothetical protein CM15mP49_03100 [Actinomycetota bacterium]|nr:MAG: hypothetical protein CM15mP49_03100 [Actinomycetota bacterium]